MTPVAVSIPDPVVAMFVVLGIILLLTVGPTRIGRALLSKTRTPPIGSDGPVLSDDDRSEIVRTVGDIFSNHQDPEGFMRALEGYTGLFPALFGVQRTGSISENLGPRGRKWVQFTVTSTANPGKEEVVTVWLS